MSAIFYFVWQIYYNQPSTEILWWRGSIIIILLYTLMLFIFVNLYGATKIGILRLNEIIYSFVLSILITNALMYLQLCLLNREIIIISPIIKIAILQIWISSFGSYLVNKVYFKLYPAREIIVVRTKSDSAKLLINKLKLKNDRFNVKEVISESCNINTIKRCIDKYPSVLLCNIEPKLRENLFKYASLQKKRVYVVPSSMDVMLKNSHNTQLFDTPIFYCKNVAMSSEQAFAKRFLDLFIAIIGLIICIPFMIITAIAIKIEDGGPILFKQERLTIHGKRFNIYKFRSMVIDAEKNGIQLAEKNDSRITKVGNIIRKIRFDELPQIFNIINGDMSIVGPRPERPEISKEYEKIIPEFKLRLNVKSGLTGYAQIYGKYNTTPQDKLLLDLMYIENYSFLLDIRLILVTIKILFMPESTEGIESGLNLPIHIETKDNEN